MKVFRSPSLAYLIVSSAALAFLVWINAARIERLDAISALGGWSDRSTDAPTAAASTPPHEEIGNGLIVPEHLIPSYHWLAQTQQMLQRHDWRIRRIDYENAPRGRDVYSPSPYRWWLGVIAWTDHALTGRAAARCVEQAARWTDPLLHVLFLLGGALLVGRRFGAIPATVFSIGCVGLYPFATIFLPGAPDDYGLSLICAVASVLLLPVGVRSAADSSAHDRSPRLWFILAGVAGGLGLWLKVSLEVPVLIGVSVGGLLAAFSHRRADPRSPDLQPAELPWRAWAWSGALTSLAAYLLEYAPSYLGGWHLTTIHPLHSLAWLGAGELLTQANACVQVEAFRPRLPQLAKLAVALVAVAALPVAAWKMQGAESFPPDPAALRLSRLPDSAIAQDFGHWIVREAGTLPVVATVLPLALLVGAGWIFFRPPLNRLERIRLSIACGPVAVALIFATRQLIWWNALDGLLLVLLVVATASWADAFLRRALGFVGAIIACLLPGWWLVARSSLRASAAPTQSEVYALVERDLAAYLAARTEPSAVILAPPNESTALCYYSGFRGIGSLSLENKDGVSAAVRILSASTAQEAKELIDQRGITHLVLLSWDSYFDDYARSGTGQIEGTFRQLLQFSTLPPWLRPVPYHLPTIAGFEGHSVVVFEVVDEQDDATAESRLAEYFLELGEVDQANAVSQTLRRFPGDLVAWVARAEVELARQDNAGVERSLKFIEARLAGRNAPVLPWDVRVGLAVVLAKTKQTALAAQQVKLCVDTADEKKVRALSTGALYRLLVLTRGFDLPLDPQIRQQAITLLPADLRERLK
jgi:hypothetical protein